MLEFVKNNKGLLIGLGVSISGFVYEAFRANKLQDELIESKNAYEATKFALKQANYELKKSEQNNDL